jgi:hypothetical protein
MPIDRYTENSTSYQHPQESNLLNIHKSMEYNVLGQPIVRTNLGSSATDAFGRFRVSQPFTLFDSFHRYQDNNRVSIYTTGTNSTSTHESYSGAVVMSIETAANAAVYRESSRVFSYQPGKSLLILQTFVMDHSQLGKRTRIGYFDTNNGLFLERQDSNIYFVKRSTSQTGSPVDTRVAKDQWNLNRLDGTDAGKITLDLSTAQIFFTEIEWLGVGSVTQGFVIDGQFVPCHRWDWANQAGSTSSYMATACLPVRAEIENISETTSTSQLKLICTSVISEGGFELRGRPLSVGHDLTGYLMSGNTQKLYPLLSIRLKSTRTGAVVLPRNFSLAVKDAAMYKFQLISGPKTTGGDWLSAGSNSSVEYNLSATGFDSTGTVLETGFIASSNQSSSAPSLADFPFKYQLERNSFNNTSQEFVIACQHDGNNLRAWASINWEEIT